MEQTPIHHQHNPDLLRMMPSHAKRIVEVGCSSGSLAREYKKSNPDAHYTGIEVEPLYAETARAHCDRVLDLDVENVDADYLARELAADCWVFGDVLEHLRDPWQLLNNIYQSLPSGGSVVACIPNAQHWSVQARLSVGDFRYQDSGLFDRTHIRWFTRVTMLEMFQNAGFIVEAGVSRVFDEPQREAFLPIIGAMAAAAGGDAESAVQDAIPFQYVFRAVVVRAD